jgi:hypothetical protein
MADSEEFRAQIRRATELLEDVVADPSVLEVMPEHERIRFVNGKATAGYENRGERIAPALETLLKRGF